MSLTHQQADAVMTDAVKGGATPHVWLHVGSPGAAGTANVAQTDAPANIVRKPISFGDLENHPSNTERRVLSAGDAITWTGEQIAAGQELTHFSIWTLLSDGSPQFVGTITTPKTTGSDGVTIAIGDLELALQVFAKPD